MQEEYQKSRQCDNEEMVMRFRNLQSVFDNEKVSANMWKQAVQFIHACRVLAPA